MTKKVKRTISLIIAVIMLLSTMTVLALAADTYGSVTNKEFGPHDCVPSRRANGQPVWTEVPELYAQPTCTKEGLAVYVVKCSICGKELDRIQEVLPQLKSHVPEEQPRIENVVEPTCARPGSYDVVTRCRFCYKLLDSQSYVVLPTNNHVPAAPVKEFCIPATCASEGSYDSVVYCKVCGIELQRTLKIVPKTTYHTSTTIRPLSATPDFVVDGVARWILRNPGQVYSNTVGYTRTCADGEDICPICGEMLNPAIPHVWDKGQYLTVTDRPTYIDAAGNRIYQQGKITYTCLICGAQKFEMTKMANPIQGDVDADGMVTTADARLILRYAVGLGSYDKIITDKVTFDNADIDGNEKVEPADARLCLRLAVGLAILNA